MRGSGFPAVVKAPAGESSTVERARENKEKYTTTKKRLRPTLHARVRIHLRRCKGPHTPTKVLGKVDSEFACTCFYKTNLLSYFEV